MSRPVPTLAPAEKPLLEECAIGDYVLLRTAIRELGERAADLHMWQAPGGEAWHFIFGELRDEFGGEFVWQRVESGCARAIAPVR